MGYEIYKCYSDRGISGKNIKNRPALKELLKDADEGKFYLKAVVMEAVGMLCGHLWEFKVVGGNDSCNGKFRMYLKIGDWNAAIEALRKAYEFAQETDSRMAIALTLGDLYWLANGDAKRALEWVETAHAIDENDVAAIYMALWINAEMGGLEGHAKAEQYAEKLARILFYIIRN